MFDFKLFDEGLLRRLNSFVLPASDGKPVELLNRGDPYLVWLRLTHEPSHKEQEQTERIDVLVELPENVEPSTMDDSWFAETAQVDFRLEALSHTGRIARFMTGSVPLEKLDLLALEAHGEKGKKQIVRFELASPHFIPAGVGLMPPLTAADATARVSQAKLMAMQLARLRGYLAEAKELQSSAVSPPESKPKSQAQGASGGERRFGQGPVVFVVDDSFNFASQRLRGRPMTLWHQGRKRDQKRGRNANKDRFWDFPGLAYGQAKPGSASDLERTDGVPYGAKLRFGGDDGLNVSMLGDEVEAYRSADYRHPSPLWSHGSAVIGAVFNEYAGAPGADPDDSQKTPAPGSVHFVQLPDSTVLDTSGGSLAGFAIDAIHHAVQYASHRGHESVIVNLSYGTHSGPHDGSSMFERAMLELLDTYDGTPSGKGNTRPVLHIVVPAGNSHLLRCHANGWLSSKGTPNESTVLYWKVQPDDDTDSFIELWFSPDADVEIEVVAPDGTVQAKTVKGQIDLFPGKDYGNKVLRGAVIYPAIVAQGTSGTMALIALAPTLRRADFGRGERYKSDDPSNPDKGLARVRMEAPSGVWKITLRNRRAEQAAGFHAWVQRDDAAPGRVRGAKGYRGRQSYLLDGPLEGKNAQGTAENLPTKVDPRFTLNGIATASHPGRRLWVVGAIEESGRISRYSSAGPDRDVGARCHGPDVVTTVDRSRNQPGRVVSGTLTGSRLRLSGTSIGAAVFTRMLHHALSVGGPHYQMECVPPTPAPAPSPPMAGEPEMAGDEYRGKCSRLRHVNDLCCPVPEACRSLKTWPATASACAPSAPCTPHTPPPPTPSSPG